MRILASPLRIVAGAAKAIAEKSGRRGLARALARLVALQQSDARVLRCRLMYMPYWVTLMKATVRRQVMPERTVAVVGAVDGFSGHAGISSSWPVLKELDVCEDVVLLPRVTQDEAREASYREVTRIIGQKARTKPELEVMREALVYKPTWVLSCRNGRSKTFYRFVDGETGYITYRYDLQVPVIKSAVAALRDI